MGGSYNPEKARAYYKKHRTRILAYKKKYVKANRDKVLQDYKDYYESHKDYFSAYYKEYYKANRKKLLALSNARYRESSV